MSGTLFTQLPFTNAASVGLLGIDVAALDDEEIIAADPRLVGWWRARDAFDATGWDTRVPDGVAKLTPGRTALPMQISGVSPDPLLGSLPLDLAVYQAYNERNALKFGLGATNGDMILANGLTIHLDAWGGDFTVFECSRHGPTDNCYFWGNNEAPVATSSGTFLQKVSTGGMALQIGGVQVIPNTATATPSFASPYDDGPHLVCSAFSDSTNKARLRIDAGVGYDKTVTGVTALNSEGTFRLGTAGPAGSGPIDGGDIAELLIFRGYIPDDAVTLARVEKIIRDRYFNRPHWWGVSAATSLTEAQVKALAGSQRAQVRAKTFTVTAASNYVYYAYPAIELAPTSFKINGSTAAFVQAVVLINGINHIVLRSTDVQTGPVTVEVI